MLRGINYLKFKFFEITGMSYRSAKSVRRGIIFGIIAGIVLGLVEIGGSAWGGLSAILPVRMSASILLGWAAIQNISDTIAWIAGVFIHLVLSAIFGLIFGWLNSGLSNAVRRNWPIQGILGMIYGFVLWLINFQLIARHLYPWYLGLAQGYQAVLFALFYGLPLGLMFAAAARSGRLKARSRPVHRLEVTPTG